MTEPYWLNEKEIIAIHGEILINQTALIRHTQQQAMKKGKIRVCHENTNNKHQTIP
ncbi:hypothetical protein [Microcystis aeruginosa]|jgi:succinyl-CoA synthetase beta subunit|uniref:hypothetical protein n=1 Tax=Microcystis aeruginosa TaxID=1126 RepID=UPI000B1F40A6|nr:hypothetical protein [Microcystis aeruginosa]BCU12849.1 hypothetical protein MAN88_34130 [Microcystis aeruginosa]